MHKIQKQILSLNYYQETGVDQFYDKALHLFYQDLKPEMERILDKHVPDDLLIDISNLDVNLGITYETELQAQWMQKFPGAFEDALLKKIKLIKDGLGVEGESIKSLSANKVDTFLFFLAEGTLPWSANQKVQNINILLDELLTNHGLEINKRFRAETFSGKMIQRLVFQFSDKQIENLTTVIQPSESNFIIQTSSELIKTQQRDQIVKAGNNEFRDAVWTFILTYLLDERGSHFNTREFMRALLKQMSVKFHIEYGLLIQEIFKSIKRLKLDPVKFRMGILLSEIYEIDVPSQTLTLEQTSNRERITDFLKSGKLKKSLNEIDRPELQGLLMDWIKHSPLDVKEFLQKQSSRTVLKRITEILTDKEILTLIQVIAPVEIKFVAGFTKEIRKQEKEQNWVQSNSKEFRKDLWVVILDVLLNDRGSHFNQKIFIISTLESLAKHYNLSPTFFIDQIFQLIELQKDFVKTSSLWNLFIEIKKELAAKKAKQPISEKVRIESYFQLLNIFKIEFNKKKRPEITDINSDKSEVIKYLIGKDQKRFRVWIIENLHSAEQAHFFISDLDFKEIQILVKTLKPTFEKQLSQVSELLSKLEEMDSRIPKFNTSELYVFAFVFLISSKITTQFLEHFISFLIEKIATEKNIETTKIADLISEVSEASSMKLPKSTFNFLIKKYSLDAGVKTKKSNIKSTSNDQAKSETLVPLELKKWEQEIVKQATVKELDQWVNGHLKTIASIELTKIKHLLVLYFKQWQKIKSKSQQIPGIKFDKIIAVISMNELPFLGHYLADLVLLFKDVTNEFKGISSSWIKSKILFFWSHKNIVSQLELTKFLMREICLKTSTPEIKTKELLLKKADALNRELSSTIILDLSSKEIHAGMKEETQSIEKNKENIIPKPKQLPMKSEEEDINTQYISNSGLVLLNPFITSLFEKTQLVDRGKFIDEEKKTYAIHLLQYCVNNSEGQPEHLLSLPKILCGIDLDEPIKGGISIKEQDKELVQSLLKAMISQWSVLGNTSEEGFQQSFLEREGALRMLDDRWELEIEQRAYDLLIDQIPWTFSLIKLPWMTKPIYTKWR